MKYRIWRLGKPFILCAALAALGGMVMLLWNTVMPAVFQGAHPIDYWHAMGLLVLSRILFGGFRGNGGWRRHRHWRRWEAMTPVEREEFKRRFATRYERTQEET